MLKGYTSYRHINGHFDPLTVSVVRTQADVRNAELNSLLRKPVWQEGQRPSKEPAVEELLISLTGRHEQEHFIRHASNELGLFITLLLHIRLYSAVTVAYHSDPWQRDLTGRLVAMTDRLLMGLIHGAPMSQGEVVGLANFVLSHFELGGPAFSTATPTAPAFPNGYGYVHFLEASAVLNEYGLCRTLGLTPESIRAALRLNDRDPGLYFSLATSALECAQGVVPLAIMLVRKALDVPIPGVGSAYRGPIEWTRHCPDCRFHALAPELLAAFGSQGVPATSEEFRRSLLLYDTLVHFLSAMDAQLIGSDTMLEVQSSDDYAVSPDAWQGRLTHQGRQLLLPVLGFGRPIVEHLCDSFTRLRPWRRNYPLSLFSNFFGTWEQEIVEKGPKEQIHKVASPIFSIVDREFRSSYIRDHSQRVGAAFRFLVMSLTVSAEASGLAHDRILEQVRETLDPADPMRSVLDDMVTGVLSRSVFKHYQG